jgi:hypothetical protein
LRDWKEKEAGLRKELTETEAQRRTESIKAKRLDEMTSVLDGRGGGKSTSGQDIHDHVRVMTRKVATYEVNQDHLARRYNLLLAETQQLRTDRDGCRRDGAEMEREMKTRVLWLELWRRGAGALIGALQETLDDMVPRDGYEVVARDLEALKERHALTSVGEAKLASASALSAGNKRQVQELTHQLQLTAVDQQRTHADLNMAKDEVERFRSICEGGLGDLGEGYGTGHGTSTERERECVCEEKRGGRYRKNSTSPWYPPLVIIERVLCSVGRRYGHRRYFVQEVAGDDIFCSSRHTHILKPSDQIVSLSRVLVSRVLV